MTDFREQHIGAVHSAINTIAEAQERISALTEQIDVALRNTVAATGNSNMESAINSRHYVRLAHEKQGEVFHLLNGAAQELRRYGDGF